MLKNIVLVQVVIILVLTGMNIAKNELIDSMTEYQVEQNLVVKK